MKKIIVTLGFIILGVYMVATLINGNTNSFKSSADGVRTKGVSQITTITN